MRVEKIRLSGYKRLADASFYVNRRLVALVGPNEAGKSSILNALTAVENDDALPAKARTRTLPTPDSGEVAVEVTYRLSKGDRDLLIDVTSDSIPTTFVRRKHFDGSVSTTLNPSPKFPVKLFDDARDALPKILDALKQMAPKLTGTMPATPEGVVESAADYFIRTIPGAIGKFPRTVKFSSEQWRALNDLRDEWNALDGLEGVKKAWAGLSNFYNDVFGEPGPEKRMVDILKNSVPEFQMFSTEDRNLRDEYDLDEWGSASEVPKLVRNLLTAAGLTFERLQELTEDEGLAETVVSQANKILAAKFQKWWGQRDISLYLKTEGRVLKVFVEDLDDGARALFNDRSDGLRMFVALALFLESSASDRPPVLLIDEADMHLHIDAQADLVSLLSDLDEVKQVIYTTHSPGCLPQDLGTGVRFVVPDEQRPSHSVVASNFWSRAATGKGFGFLPMLYMLGAQSAAFSRLRNAIIVEGPTEAILLPSLIRTATGREELDYQIVPGLSEVSDETFAELSAVAVNVVYSVDGDGGGTKLDSWLESQKVPSSRRSRLDDGFAIEDLLEPSVYVAAVNSLTSKARKPFTESDMLGKMAKHAANEWAASQKVKLPGPVVVAETLLTHVEAGSADLALRPEGIAQLKKLHTKAQRAFAATRSR